MVMFYYRQEDVRWVAICPTPTATTIHLDLDLALSLSNMVVTDVSWQFWSESMDPMPAPYDPWRVVCMYDEVNHARRQTVREAAERHAESIKSRIRRITVR
jgi:hypothetical protein